MPYNKTINDDNLMYQNEDSNDGEELVLEHFIINTSNNNFKPYEDADYIGSIYFDTDNHRFEGLYDDLQWKALGGVVDTDGDTFISAERGISDEDILFFYADDGDEPRMTMSSNLLSVNIHIEIISLLIVHPCNN
mgnify:CR=1 FL=1